MSNLPPLEYARREPRRQGRTWWRSPWPFWTLVACVSAMAVLVAVAVPTAPSPEKQRKLKCASNLRTIGQVLTLYASEYHGILAPDLQTMAVAEVGNTGFLICPGDRDGQAPPRDTAGENRTCSYVYIIGATLTMPLDPKCIMALEDPTNHDLKGANVLFADGHMEFLDLPTTQLILNDLDAGRNPPATLTPNLSQAGAEQDYQKHWKPRMPQLKTGVWRIPATQPAIRQPE